MRDAGLAHLGKVVGNGGVPDLATVERRRLTPVVEIECPRLARPAEKHECMRPVGLDQKIVGRELMGTLGDGERLGEVAREERGPRYADQLVSSLFARRAGALRLIPLD